MAATVASVVATMASPASRVPVLAPPAPDATFSIDEVARHAGVSVRAIRHYVERRVAPRQELKSIHTPPLRLTSGEVQVTVTRT